MGVYERRRRNRRARNRAIFLLPNLITAAGLMFGFWSITLSIRGDFDRAALMIILATICDLLDGRVARATQTSSPFGVEFDSMSDLVSFGMAPALLVYNWTLLPLGNRGWLLAGMFALCAAMRLARFNVKAQVEDSMFYQGIPSTFAGGMIAATVWFVTWCGFEPPFSRPLGGIITGFFVLLSLLMVSSVPYPSLKFIKIEGSRAYPTLVAVLLFSIAILLNHDWMLFALGVLFILSGPALWWMRRKGVVGVSETLSPTAEASEETSDV